MSVDPIADAMTRIKNAEHAGKKEVEVAPVSNLLRAILSLMRKYGYIQDFEVIDNGTNQTIVLTARDQNGCEITDTVNINTPTDITFSYNVNPITCDTSGTGVSAGSIDIIVNEGPGDYEVQILPLGSEPARSSGGSDRVTWDIATPGNYIFAVTDVGSGGCTYLTATVNMPEYNTIEAVIAEVEPVMCFNGSDGVGWCRWKINSHPVHL